MPANGDALLPFIQNSDLFYLTGIDQEKTILLLAPDCPNPDYREVLFLLETNETIAVWEGHKFTKEEAQSTSGIKNIHWISTFQQVLDYTLKHAEYVYLNLNENDRATGQVPYLDLRFANELKQRFPLHQFRRSAPILAALRMFKKEEEIVQLREAIRITELAFRRILRFVKPGVAEYEIEAEIIHEFIRNRANGHAYHPIIASGASACVLHYVENNKQCHAGELLLMDFGANYGNYNADLTRCIPVNGMFSERQKEVYNAVLKVHRESIQLMKSGVSLFDLNKQAHEIMEQALASLGLLRSKDKEERKHAASKYFPHGIGHFLGLDVHDVGNRFAALQAGMVLTCEPGIYIREENLGIRIENNILVTETEPIDLMLSIPIEAEEIESLMHS